MLAVATLAAYGVVVGSVLAQPCEVVEEVTARHGAVGTCIGGVHVGAGAVGHSVVGGGDRHRPCDGDRSVGAAHHRGNLWIAAGWGGSEIDTVYIGQARGAGAAARRAKAECNIVLLACREVVIREVVGDCGVGSAACVGLHGHEIVGVGKAGGVAQLECTVGGSACAVSELDVDIHQMAYGLRHYCDHRTAYGVGLQSKHVAGCRHRAAAREERHRACRGAGAAGGSYKRPAGGHVVCVIGSGGIVGLGRDSRCVTVEGLKIRCGEAHALRGESAVDRVAVLICRAVVDHIDVIGGVRSEVADNVSVVIDSDGGASAIEETGRAVLHSVVVCVGAGIPRQDNIAAVVDVRLVDGEVGNGAAVGQTVDGYIVNGGNRIVARRCSATITQGNVVVGVGIEAVGAEIVGYIDEAGGTRQRLKQYESGGIGGVGHDTYLYVAVAFACGVGTVLHRQLGVTHMLGKERQYGNSGQARNAVVPGLENEGFAAHCITAVGGEIGGRLGCGAHTDVAVGERPAVGYVRGGAHVVVVAGSGGVAVEVVAVGQRGLGGAVGAYSGHHRRGVAGAYATVGCDVYVVGGDGVEVGNGVVGVGGGYHGALAVGEACGSVLYLVGSLVATHGSPRHRDVVARGQAAEVCDRLADRRQGHRDTVDVDNIGVGSGLGNKAQGYVVVGSGAEEVAVEVVLIFHKAVGCGQLRQRLKHHEACRVGRCGHDAELQRAAARRYLLVAEVELQVAHMLAETWQHGVGRSTCGGLEGEGLTGAAEDVVRAVAACGIDEEHHGAAGGGDGVVLVGQSPAGGLVADAVVVEVVVEAASGVGVEVVEIGHGLGVAHCGEACHGHAASVAGAAECADIDVVVGARGEACEGEAVGGGHRGGAEAVGVAVQAVFHQVGRGAGGVPRDGCRGGGGGAHCYVGHPGAGVGVEGDVVDSNRRLIVGGAVVAPVNHKAVFAWGGYVESVGY